MEKQSCVLKGRRNRSQGPNPQPASISPRTALPPFQGGLGAGGEPKTQGLRLASALGYILAARWAEQSEGKFPGALDWA